MQRIALIGPAGVGKSTTGRLLASRRNISFFDLDSVIENVAKVSVEDIFRGQGEHQFRKFEIEQLNSITNPKVAADCICATGGGIVISDAARRTLKQDWYTIYLEASTDTLVKRLADEQAHRPLFYGNTSLSVRITELYATRRQLYEDVARWSIAVDGMKSEEVVSRICRHLDWV